MWLNYLLKEGNLLACVVGVGQNINTAIYRCPSSCDTRNDALSPNMDILKNKIKRFE